MENRSTEDGDAWLPPSDDFPMETGVSDAKLTCFAIGPIGNKHAQHGSPERDTYEEALRVMEEVVAPAASAVELSPVRSDSLARAGEINEQIFRRLRDDDVVIADVTGANANVMYELGLRHTEDKLTVQIGEFGRLPFDVSMIRTIQFSRSPVGLINARDELIQVLTAGVAGQYDPVTATRVWRERAARPQELDGSPGSSDDALPAAKSGTDAPIAGTDDGFLDVVAEAEERQDEMVAALGAVGDHIVALGDLAEGISEEIDKSDAAGAGMRGRLRHATRFAAGLDGIAPKLEQDVDQFVSALKSVSAGNLALIDSLEADPAEFNEPAVQEWAMTTRAMAAASREGVASLSSTIDAITENAKLARVLRKPSTRLTASLRDFLAATTGIDEWDRRLESLGVEVPPGGWEPSADEDAADGTAERPADDAPSDDNPADEDSDPT